MVNLQLFARTCALYCIIRRADMQSYRFRYNVKILPFLEKIREEFRLNREN